MSTPSASIAASAPFRGPLVGGLARTSQLVPAAAAIAYPFWLDAFHVAIGPAGGTTPMRAVLAALALAGAFLMPALGFIYAWKGTGPTPMRRLAYASVMAPTLYVFLGVVTYMVKSHLPDELVWSVLWLAIAGIALASPERAVQPASARSVARWRVAHGVTAAVIVFYFAFHIFNHLFFLTTPATYDAVQKIGETVYRNPVVQPILVLLLLFQTITGMRLFWHWSAQRGDFFRTFQLAAGIFLAAYVIGHMDSVFVYARGYLDIPSDWAFATGAPAGMLHDAWNIRLLPHYLLGVFFLLGHLASGGRGILIAHGAPIARANRAWTAAVAASGVVAVAIMLGMTGIVDGLPG